MELAFCQLEIIWENRRANLEYSARSKQYPKNIQISIFPEMRLTGFSMESSTVAETL